jgi:archaellum biogenesis ATPase FlaH
MPIEVTKAGEAPQIVWLVDGILAERDILCLVGQSGSGKTTFALILCYHLNTGSPFLGQKVRQCRTLFIAQDEGISRIRQKVSLLEPSFPGITELPVLKQSVNWRTLSELRLKGEYDVVVLDSLSSVGITDEDSAGEVGVVLSSWRDLVNREGISLIILHHQGDNKSKAWRGSTAIRDKVDSMFLLNKGQFGVTLKNIKLRDFELPTFVVTDLLDYGCGTTQADFALQLIQSGKTPDEARRLVMEAFGRNYHHAQVVVNRASRRTIDQKPSSST